MITVYDASVSEDADATQDPVSGEVKLTKKLKDFTVVFPRTLRTDSLRLSVTESDLGASDNIVLTEVIVSGNKELLSMLFLF